MLPIHTILHPTDFSQSSGHAFALVSALARDYHARLIVLHVVPTWTTQILSIAQLGTESPENVRANFAKALERLQAADPAVHVERRLEEGNPVAQILHVAQETRADLLVLGTHGRSGLGRLLMGSVAEQVMREASCPVLMVKMPS